MSRFEDKVGEQMATGKTKAAAVRHVARHFPDLHKTFISRAQSPGFKFTIMMPPQGSSFEAVVSQAMAIGKTKGDAIRCVARDYPDLHEQFVIRAQSHKVRLPAGF